MMTTEQDWTTQTIQRWFEIYGPSGSVLASYWVEAEIAWRWHKGTFVWQIDCWTSEPDPSTPAVEDALHEQLCEYMDSEFSP